MKRVAYRDKRFCVECARLYCRLVCDVWHMDRCRLPRVREVDLRNDPPRAAAPGTHWCHGKMDFAANMPALLLPHIWRDDIKWKWLVHWMAHCMVQDHRHDRLFNDHHKLAKDLWRMFFTHLMPGVADLELHVQHRELLKEDHCDVLAWVCPREHPLAVAGDA